MRPRDTAALLAMLAAGSMAGASADTEAAETIPVSPTRARRFNDGWPPLPASNHLHAALRVAEQIKQIELDVIITARPDLESARDFLYVYRTALCTASPVGRHVVDGPDEIDRCLFCAEPL